MNIPSFQYSQNPTKETVIECFGLESVYSQNLQRPILNGIDCRVQQGEFVALLGLNGAGKSSLLRSLIGLMPITRGKIVINGTPLNSHTLSPIRRQVGMLFQGGGLIPQLSVIDNVLCGKLGNLKPQHTLFGFPKQDRRQGIELLERLGLREHVYQKVYQLSGGQQQRVAIARALIQSPSILLADEPTTGLDVVASQQVMETLATLNYDKGITIVAVLHDLGIARQYAHRAIILDAGKVVYDGGCDQLQDKFMQMVTN